MLQLAGGEGLPGLYPDCYDQPRSNSAASPERLISCAWCEMPLDHSVTPGERSRVVIGPRPVPEVPTADTTADGPVVRHSTVGGALYGADEDLPELCRCCGEELDDPLESFCPVCQLAGTRAPWPDEGLLNP